MLPFLFLNVVVSALVVLSILFWWDSRDQRAEAAVKSTAAAITAGEMPTPNIAAPPTGAVPVNAPVEAGSDQPVTHTVQAGETLNIISQRYDVSIDDIMLVNGLDNPNFIAAGQTLVIPIGGVPEPTPVPTETMVALPSPIPTEPAAAGGGQIGVAAVLDPGVLETESVELVNNGAQAQSLEGWKVRDEDSNVYTFGNVSIFDGGASIRLFTRAGDDTFRELHWGLSAPIWRSGETLTLWDASGQVVATFVVP